MPGERSRILLFGMPDKCIFSLCPLPEWGAMAAAIRYANEAVWLGMDLLIVYTVK